MIMNNAKQKATRCKNIRGQILPHDMGHSIRTQISNIKIDLTELGKTSQIIKIVLLVLIYKIHFSIQVIKKI